MHVPVTAPPVVPRSASVPDGLPSFDTFEDAYVENLRLTYRAPMFRNAPRGYPSRERLGIAFAIRNPRERVVRLAARRSNIVFNFAEALWYLSGSDDLEMIAYYASNMRRYSTDGKRLTGTAYGPKIFRNGLSCVNQWKHAVETLRQDPETKRAVLQIFSPEEYLVADNPDVSCTMALQFMIREGALHAVTFMRANDAFRGVVSDIFSFTFLQEVMATELGVGLGRYHHNVGSFHVYDADETWAADVIAAAENLDTVSTVEGVADPFPAMPAKDNWSDIGRVLELEAMLRTNTTRLAADAISDLPLSPYWQQVACLLEIYRQVVHERRIDSDHLAVLLPAFRPLVAARWPRLAAEQMASALD